MAISNTKQTECFFHSDTASFPYFFTRSRRKTIEVSIREGQAYVRAPMRMARRDIEAFLHKKADWVAKHIARQKEGAPETKAYVPGELFPLFGKEYPLLFGAGPGFDGESITVCPEALDPAAIRKALHEVYFAIAKEYIPKSVARYAPLFKETPSGIAIKEMKSQWGSCSAKNRLSFNVKLVLYDEAVVDYVVVHELAHLVHRNHSKDFWAAVEQIMPDYKKQRAKLKEAKVY